MQHGEASARVGATRGRALGVRAIGWRRADRREQRRQLGGLVVDHVVDAMARRSRVEQASHGLRDVGVVARRAVRAVGATWPRPPRDGRAADGASKADPRRAADRDGPASAGRGGGGARRAGLGDRRSRRRARRSVGQRGDAAAVIERAVAERVANVRARRAHSRVALEAATRLASASVTAVAVDLGLSERHLRRIFRETVGVSPKAFAKLVRFHRALRAAREARPVNWRASPPRPATTIKHT